MKDARAHIKSEGVLQKTISRRSSAKFSANIDSGAIGFDTVAA
jgi:hypothetical protein